jgi:hypothetical protein
VSVPRRDIRISIAIPSSLFSEISHLREKTAIIGRIARTAVIHRVEGVYVYSDEPDEARLIRLLLSYIETPQYLRKRLFRRMDELRYVGILPPLRTPHHPLGKRTRDLSRGEYREGVVLEEQEGEFLVDVGVERPAEVTGNAPSIGGRATVQITQVGPELRGRFVGRGEIEQYWGYEVHTIKSGVDELASHGDFGLILGTSRHAPALRDVEDSLMSRLTGVGSLLVVFGSPRRGLREMLSGGKSLEGVFDLSVNTIPLQGVETVRTEEAVCATLAILNHLLP